MPPGLTRVAVAAAGAAAVAIGAVAAANGRTAGITIVLGGVVLLAWTLLRPGG
ncbi:MAG TPA: hypothetical protein VNT58_02005 [Gaiellaceae bacterium]|nr:hypothetical protein [Gaiellaceae bacterium]